MIICEHPDWKTSLAFTIVEGLSVLVFNDEEFIELTGFEFLVLIGLALLLFKETVIGEELK